MNPEIDVRSETDDDIGAIAEVTIAAFETLEISNHTEQFIIRYADRLLFGRDQYGNDLDKFLPTLDLPEDVLTRVHSENALRLVPLD